jgi:hypothetical protein
VANVRQLLCGNMGQTRDHANNRECKQSPFDGQAERCHLNPDAATHNLRTWSSLPTERRRDGHLKEQCALVSCNLKGVWTNCVDSKA